MYILNLKKAFAGDSSQRLWDQEPGEEVHRLPVVERDSEEE